MKISDLEHFRDLLLERERALYEWEQSCAPVDKHDSDKAEQLLGEIRNALHRVNDHSYGTCKTCTGTMEMHRLEVQPVRQVCLDCIDEVERTSLEEELFLASKIHRALLPQQIERIPGFEVAAKSLAAHLVGGDYYDILPAANSGPARVVIADSMGKGLPAGLVMSNLQGALRILAQEHTEPAHLISHLNHWLCRNIPVTNFISLTCLALQTPDETESRLSYANAGHLPPIVVHPNGAVEQLDATGTVIGVHEDFRYEENQLTLTAGDLVLLYTDGVTEAEDSQGEMFGDKRLVKFAQNHRKEEPSTLILKLLEEINQFTKLSEPADDLTVIALRKV